MKKQLFFSLLAGCFMMFTAYSASAVETQTKNQSQAPLPMSALIEKLQSKGYSIIRKIKFEEGAYEAEVINSQGDTMKVRVNPQTGDIFGSSTNPTLMNILDAVKKVESAGYHNIYRVKLENGSYEIKALDKNGKQVDLEVNTKSGKISKDWF